MSDDQYVPVKNIFLKLAKIKKLKRFINKTIDFESVFNTL